MNLSEKIKSFIYSNIVPNNKRTIGVEIEGLYYDNHFKRLPVNPTDKYSATDLLYDIKELKEVAAENEDEVTKEMEKTALAAVPLPYLDSSLNLISAYGVYNLNDTSALFARIDMLLDENPFGGPGYLPIAEESKMNLLLLGYDMKCSSGLHLIPIVEMVMYDGKDNEGKDLDSDIVARLTFSYKWK